VSCVVLVTTESRSGLSVTAPTDIQLRVRRVALAGLQIQVMPGRQDVVVIARVLLGRADVADAAVAMLDVVPAHELGGPGPGLLKACEALGWELWLVLGRSEQRLGIGFVVAHARPRVRGLDTQPLQHRQHCRGLEGRAVVAMVQIARHLSNSAGYTPCSRHQALLSGSFMAAVVITASNRAPAPTSNPHFPRHHLQRRAFRRQQPLYYLVLG
jgi:hypothetical protein